MNINKLQFGTFALLLLTQLPAYTVAGNVPADNHTSKPDYLSSAQVSREDYREMSNFRLSYNECLQKISYAKLADYHDPRHVVDFAMKQCATKLETLEQWLTEKKFPPTFKKGYIRKISHQSVRRIMPEIMFLMSQQQ